VAVVVRRGERAEPRRPRHRGEEPLLDAAARVVEDVVDVAGRGRDERVTVVIVVGVHRRGRDDRLAHRLDDVLTRRRRRVVIDLEQRAVAAADVDDPVVIVLGVEAGDAHGAGDLADLLAQLAGVVVPPRDVADEAVGEEHHRVLARVVLRVERGHVDDGPGERGDHGVAHADRWAPPHVVQLVVGAGDDDVLRPLGVVRSSCRRSRRDPSDPSCP